MSSIDRVRYPTYLEAPGTPGAARLSTWISMGVLGVGAASLGLLGWRNPALLGTLTLASCIAIVPLSMRGIYSIFLSWVPDVPSFVRQDQASPGWERWFQEQFDHFTSSRVPGYIGLAYAIVATALFWFGGAFASLPLVMVIVCLVVAAVASFVCGVGLVALFCLARFIWQVGYQYQVRVSEHGYGVLSTGKMLVKCYGLVAIVWCLYTGSATWSPRARILLLALAAPAMIFFVGSFVICQFPLHRRMVECKRAALVELDDLLERLAPKHRVDMSEERRRKLDFCVAEIARVRRWPEWPFSAGNLTGVMGAAVGAIVPQLVQILKVLIPLVVKKP